MNDSRKYTDIIIEIEMNIDFNFSFWITDGMP